MKRIDIQSIQVSMYPKKMDIHVSKYPCIQVCMISKYPIIQVSKKNQYPRYPCIRISEKSGIHSSLVGREDVKRSIESFPPGSSGGPDGLLPQHLKDMTAESLGEPAYKLVDALVEFNNKIVLCGKVPSEVCPIFYGANLTALSKPDCRLFWPHQLGVGTPKGAEAAVHAIRAYINSPNISDKVLLKIDFKNAFNQVRRDVILKLVKEYTPEIYQYVYQCYSTTSSLYFAS